AIEPRDWVYVSDAKANDIRVYGAVSVDRGVPTPDVNGKINMVLNVRYRLTSSPSGGFLHISGFTKSTQTDLEFPTAANQISGTFVDVPFSIAFADGDLDRPFFIYVEQRDSQHERINQPAQAF